MLHVNVSGTAALLKKLQRLPSSIRSVLLVALNQQMAQLQSFIVTDFLSGQILMRRSGRLARSVVPVPAKTVGTNITAGVAAGGGPAFYGKFFEETATGGTGGIGHAWAINAVKGRALAFMHEGKLIFRQYTFHPPLPARPFLIPAAEIQLPEMIAALNEVIDEELNKP